MSIASAIRVLVVGHLIEVLGQLLALDTIYEKLGNLLTSRVHVLAGALGATLGGLVCLAKRRGIFVFWVQLCVSHLGLFGHFPERSTLLVGELIPVAAGDAGDISVVPFDAFEVVLVP